jgi:ABC-type phosphate transport system permease subunit
MNYIRALKDKSARHIMLGIAIFAMLFLAVIGIGLFIKALPIIREKGVWVLLMSGNWRPFKGEFGFLPYILISNSNRTAAFTAYQYLSEYLCIKELAQAIPAFY